MSESTLYIWDHNYSSWSLRGYLCARLAGLNPRLVNLSEHEGEDFKRLRELSPSRLFPLLVRQDGGETIRVWESLAIAEYLSECFPDSALWPKERSARALARSVAAQMHAGFSLIRNEMPMNTRARYPGTVRSAPLRAEIQQVVELWHLCQEASGRGPYLFGDYCVADAFFAPVALRFITYDVALEPAAQAYVQAQVVHPDVAQWLKWAATEKVVRPQYEFAR